MLKKCAILGLAVLLVGAAALGWLLKETQSEQEQTSSLKAKYSLQPEEHLDKYGRWHLLSPEERNQLVLELDNDGKGKTREQLAQEQQVRLRVDLGKLAADEMHPGEIADFLYGPGWEEEVRKYKKREEQKEIARTTSIVCISIGGTILGGCLVIWFLWAVVGLCRRLRRRRIRPAVEPDNESQNPELADIHPETPEEDPEDAEPQPTGRKKLRSLSSTPASSDRLESRPEDESMDSLPRALGFYTPPPLPTLSMHKAQDEHVAVLLTDEKAPQTSWSPQMQWSTSTMPDNPREEPAESAQFSAQTAVCVLDPPEQSPDVSSTLEEQAEELQRQLAEVKQMAQSAQQASREPSEPLGNTLRELAQQVSAIREYAASQQDRVEKLQDGYDWSIIRTFCLRVIRCIDNVEGRLSQVGGSDEASASHLEEIRDELLFALESSGVEQFQVDVHSEYRGQEKLAEAIKDRQACKKPELAGTIAKVIRPGYRYMIDDENFKIVRTAQVKLYG